MIDANIIVPVILFLLLSQPSVYLPKNVLVRAILFAVIYYVLRQTFPSYY